ncbi:rCG31043 [Rattus norvegicus]|uniref:RCG31043 n=1 Tax=Rattus norvegicus TaxID=10116 RepID=A6ISH0_RAT|nr:rCG31043 [Rattus norvegicus]
MLAIKWEGIYGSWSLRELETMDNTISWQKDSRGTQISKFRAVLYVFLQCQGPVVYTEHVVA